MIRKSLIDAQEVYNLEISELIKAIQTPAKPYNFADVVTKLSKRGLISHQRILQIKNGFLFYYKRVPKGWKKNNVDLLKDNPKMGTRLSEILISYLGNEVGTNSKYIDLQLNVKKIIQFKTGRNFVEDYSKIKDEANFQKFKWTKKSLCDARLVFSTKNFNIDNIIIDLLSEKIFLEKNKTKLEETKQIDKKEEIIADPPKPKLFDILNKQEKEDMLKNLRASNINDDSSLSLQQDLQNEGFSEVEPMERPQRQSNNVSIIEKFREDNDYLEEFERISDIKEPKNLDFPQQSHLFSTIKPKPLNKSFFSHEIRNYEGDFFNLLQKLKITEKEEKEIIYQDIFSLIGEFKLFCEETTRNFIENQTHYKDFREIVDNNKTNPNVKTFVSDTLHLMIKISGKNLIEYKENCESFEETQEENSLNYKHLSQLFKGYDYLLNGILSLLEYQPKSANFQIPLANLITYKSTKLLLLTHNPIIFSPDSLIHGFSNGNYNCSKKFLEDLSPLAEVLGIENKKIPLAVGLNKYLEVFQKDLLANKSEYLLMNPIEILPPNPKFNEIEFVNFRPELLYYKKHYLEDFQDVSDKIENEILETIISELEDLKEIPLDSEAISDLLHNYGINIRYLGVMYKKTEQIYLKDLLLKEIICRTVKNFFNHHMLSSMRNPYKYEELLTDFLNLIFGIGTETEVFWEENVPEEIFNTFKVKLKISLKDINESLFNKIITSCLVGITPRKNDFFPLNQEIPFRITDFESCQMKTKGYSLKGLSYYQILKSESEIAITKDLIECFKANLSLYSMKKTLKSLSEAQDFGLNLCELYLRNENYEQSKTSLQKLLSHQENSNRMVIKGNFLLFRAFLGLNQTNDFLELFSSIINNLEKNIGPFHPFHILLYEQLAKYYQNNQRFEDAVFLIKNALVCGMKILGSNHWVIGSLYELLGDNYYGQKYKDDSLFYWQKSYEIIRKRGLGFKIANLLLEMNKILEAKDFFLGLLEKNLEKDEEIYMNLSHLSLILNENEEAENFLRMGLEKRNSSEDFVKEYEEKLIKIGFFLVVRKLDQIKKKFIWFIARNLIEFGVKKIDREQILCGWIEEMKKHWNLIDFMKDLLEEIAFVCQKNEYINDAEYWRLYLKNLEGKDPHNMKKSLLFLSYLILVVGENAFIEELMK